MLAAVKILRTGASLTTAVSEAIAETFAKVAEEDGSNEAERISTMWNNRRREIKDLANKIILRFQALRQRSEELGEADGKTLEELDVDSFMDWVHKEAAILLNDRQPLKGR